MRVIIEDSATYKKTIALACSIASKRILEPIEQCIELKAENGLLYISCIESGSHYLNTAIPVEVVKPGKLYILSSKLSDITKRLSPKNVLELYDDNGLIHYKVPVLGNIQESLFHDQTGFSPKPVSQADNKFKLMGVYSGLNDVIKLASSFSFSGKNILLSGTATELIIYSQFSETGYICYKVPTTSEAFNVYLNPKIVRIASLLGEDMTLLYNKEDNLLRFKYINNSNSFTMAVDTVESKSYAVFKKLLESAVTDYCVVNQSDLLSAIEWQSYGRGVAQSILLGSIDKELSIGGDSGARLGCEIYTKFDPINLPIESLSLALKAISGSKSKSIALEQRIHIIGNNSIKYLTVTPSEDVTIEATALVYEQLTVKK